MGLNSRNTVLAALALSLAACSASPSKQDIGTVTGGILGGVLGSQVGQGHGRDAAMVVGALAGAFIGGSIGKSMDDTDRLKMSSALENAPTGRTTSWHNPDSGNTYRVTPTRTYESAEGPCRTFTTDAVIDGRSEQVAGKACRQPNGSWKMM
ncbi:MAG: glycine zipper 2TM domain-containing protein [Sulfuricellaceae bacterium]|nr:glycine zipper 2TM domain-containing protein [Sulfuricellaceae bacterium]